ncbi:glutamate racemase [Clostridium tetanomorphum]|uniref:Asp/Glu/hydantoin racemase n=1 Tax=Clostridium tetanomorphum TaxID=1553 RepID=A0A923J0I9_CLOTT|nr:aspartate/glutamate racemase family protein [Clostridium tetanomorphum]KAJ49787.1 glutamate racemase [Clostridium tetanomorphum DSM 665]MBC2398127.1 Asp/Glu/hydantoin racemase [Clostridium tetanomorphum]MBP1864696.1 glutamate racemase [Clostridium tetanomorphum]NRS84166.1 glutamate racemase [Clostridium tetanomorphum]NRZ97379.1 glutamate racemase [Clostridium tetanomorphum]
MNSIKVGVIAGTPVDTQMGVDFLSSKGVCAVGYPVSSCPEEQSKFQILSSIELTNEIRSIIKKANSENIHSIMVYCNSLSAAVDMDKLSMEQGMKIITPLNIYKDIADKYESIGVLTANNQSSAGIEKAIQSKNPNCNVIGIGILPVVIEIEKRLSAESIVEKFALKKIIDFYNSIKVDVIILGCTHFPYLYKELKKYSSIPILDPAELMYRSITNI